MGLFRLVQPYLRAEQGIAIRRRFEEPLVGLLVLAGPESGEVAVTDGDGEQRAMVWDTGCHYERLMTVVLDRRCPPGEEVAIELTGRVPDYESCQRPADPPDRRDLRIVGYMLLPG
jgi:hypothetical protein